MAIFRRPDPFPVKGPSSATPKLKMVGNMMELKRPTASMVHIAVCPPNSMEAVTSAAAKIAQSANRDPGLNRRKSPAPRNRPIIAPPQ